MEHEVGINVLDGQIGYDPAVVGEGGTPLLPVLGILPGGIVRLEICFNALTEGHGLGGLKSMLLVQLMTSGKWVYAIKQLLPKTACFVPCFAKRNSM
jgi:hypothetical protein